MNQPIGLKYLILIPLVLVCFALSPQARAVCQERGCDVFGNTFLGLNALLNNPGHNNTAIAYGALSDNTIGNNNTATGVYALANNQSGSNNTATGVDALFSNSSGNNNTANGFGELYHNTSGVNTATGYQACQLW